MGAMVTSQVTLSLLLNSTLFSAIDHQVHFPANLPALLLATHLLASYLLALSQLCTHSPLPLPYFGHRHFSYVSWQYFPNRPPCFHLLFSQCLLLTATMVIFLKHL